MNHIIFEPNTYNRYKVAILIKQSSFNKTELLTNYVKPLEVGGIAQNDIIAFDLDYKNNKATVKLQKECLGNTLKAIDSLGVTTILCCDSNYFKTLTKKRKSELHYGYVLPVAIAGFGHMNAILCANHTSLFHDPSFKPKIEMGISTVISYMNGSYMPPGLDIIQSEYYPHTDDEIKIALAALHKYPGLSCDVETFGLSFATCGLGSIAFSWSDGEGIAFTVDYLEGNQIDNPTRKKLLKDFFEAYEGKLVYHNCSFDIKIIIYNLWMNDLLDQEGLLTGLEVMTKCFDDTKVITYLATNNCSGNHLGLKENVQEIAGNYAQDDIKDIGLIAEDLLLRYNLIDCLSTWYLRDKYFPTLVADAQLNIYQEIMLPSLKVTIQAELQGMPMLPSQIDKTDIELQEILKTHEDNLAISTIIIDFTKELRKEACKKKNDELKVKVKPLSDFDGIEFNPASNNQVSKLLYEYLGFDVIDTTDSGAPGVGSKTLKKLIHTTQNTEHIAILEALIAIGDVSIIINTFIAAMKRGVVKADGMQYLQGSFNVTGTKSGRMSSNSPNLQNVPSTGSVYAKHIKSCFQAPKNWLMVGADFNALEARVAALLTRDPNRLKVYTEGYDSHSLNAFSYWPEAMPDIVNTVESINSIKDKYPKLRQKSKTITFAAQYQGTYKTFMNGGFSEEEAKKIEENYHKLYVASDVWLNQKMDLAAHKGYLDIAFGLRIRTPVLSKTILGNRATPVKAKAESRTAGNAAQQSYGLLNNRAAIEFQERVLASRYRLDIKPCALVHDAIYLIIKDEVGCVEWVNRNLIECMEWDDLPELKHPTVKLGASMEIFYPSWKDSIEIPNNASKREILKIVKENN